MKTFSLVLAALLLAPAARADKFYLGTAEEAKKVAEGSNPTTIEGVLLAETDTHYHIRVVGGEVVLEKKGVFKVEKDAMTVADIVKVEKDLADKSAAEAKARDASKPVEAAGAGLRGKPVEAAVGGEAVADGKPAVGEPAGFDPVVGKVVGGDAALIDEVEAAWTLTKDRKYLKLLRKLRRAR
ncbi:MAG: hypothetical protein IPK26_14070 [Planctomycetes bacterium]|nr:hypothetical protein [Planctomycetota bacterium]